MKPTFPLLKCKLCGKYIMSNGHMKKNFKYVDTVHIKNGDWLDELFHKYCWLRLKIYDAP